MQQGTCSYPPKERQSLKLQVFAGWEVIFTFLGQWRHQDEEEMSGWGMRPDAKGGVAKGMQSSDKDGGVTFNLSQSYQAECFPLEQSWSQTNVSLLPSVPASLVQTSVTWTHRLG